MGFSVSISVTGPGGTINVEADLIYAALLKAGYNVTYNNPHKDSDSIPVFADVLKKIVDRSFVRDVTLTINHQPWGG
jgi:hypothetical protein